MSSHFFFGVKFFGGAAQLTMTVQALIFATFGIAIVLQRSWGLILGLLYFIEVIASHIIFFSRNLNVPSEAMHVKNTAVALPAVVGILWDLWLRGRPLLR